MNENETTRTITAMEPPSLSLTTAVKNLWSALNSASDRINRLNAENKELLLRAGEIEKLWLRYNEMKDSMPALEEKAAVADNLINENTKLKKENYHLQNSLAELREVEKNFNMVQTQLKSKVEIINVNTDTIKKLNDTISDNELKIYELEETLIEVRANDKTEDFEKASSEINNLKTQMREKDSLLEEKVSEIKRLNALDLNNQAKITEVNMLVAELDEKFTKADDEILILNSKVSELRRYKEENTELFEKNLVLESQLSQYENMVEDANNKITVIENDLLLKTNDMNELETKMENYQSDIKNYEVRTAEIGEELKIYESQIKKYEAEAENHEADILDYELKIEVLENKINEIKNHENIIEDVAGSKSEAEEKISLLNMQIEELNENLVIQQQENKRMNEMIEILNTENAKQKNDAGFGLNIDPEEREELLKTVNKYINKLEKVT